MKKNINDFQISTNFNLKEFVSPDTGTVKINSKLVSKLQFLRDSTGYPIIINSGYRTPKHNKKVKGKKNSSHLRGNAVDIWSKNLTIEQIFWYTRHAGFDRIIAYDHKNFLHVDVDGKKYIEVPIEWGVTQKDVGRNYKLRAVKTNG